MINGFKNCGAFFLQETKVHRKGLIKIPNFEIFETVRGLKLGGSILTGVHKSMKPVLINSDDELEILTVQAQLGQFSCRFINAYGPREGHLNDEKTIAFYAKLDQEIQNAILFGHMICLELDANAKLGCNIIEGDPHKMSPNGELLFDIIERNNLMVCNASDKCTGLITRQRSTSRSKEESIIDYFIVCQELYLQLKSMKIDDENVLTQFISVFSSKNT